MSKDKLKGLDVPFFQTPNDIFKMDQLDVYEKLVYIYLARCGNQGSKIFPSFKTIAKKCSMSKRKAINCVERLEEIGLITKKTRKVDVGKVEGKKINRTNVYTLHTPSACHAPPSAHDAPPLVHIMHPYKELGLYKELFYKDKQVVKFRKLDNNKPVDNSYSFNEIKDYVDNTTLNLTDKQINTLLSIYDDPEIIINAIQQTINKNQPAKYIKAILRNWKRNNIQTVEQAEEFTQQYYKDKQLNNDYVDSDLSENWI